MLITDLEGPEAHRWCEVCRAHEDDKCDGCKTAFLPGERRYRSQTYHYHPGGINGVHATRAIQKELCVDCYRLDFRSVYPNEPLPDLPDRGVDPKFHAARVKERK